jgi:hypothetical protein
MRIYTKEPKPSPTKVVIEMTDTEACELRDFMNPDDLSSRGSPVPYRFFKLIHEVTGEW